MEKSLFDALPLISCVRRNHGLEHATMHVLAEHFKGLPMVGLSGPRGFYLLADLPTETVTDAALVALRRLKEGQKDLAFHKNCGTNLAVPSFLAGLVAWLVMTGTSKNGRLRFIRLPWAIFSAVAVFIISKPLGPKLQRTLTTSADQENMELDQVFTQHIFGRSLHHIYTRFSGKQN